MSIGPTEKQDAFKVSLPAKIHFALKESTAAFFADPIGRLLYTSLTALIVGLFCGLEFNWKVYAIVGTLAAIRIYQHYKALYDAANKNAPNTTK